MIASRFLDTLGTGANVINGAVDASEDDFILRLAPAAGEIFEVQRLIISLTDNGGIDSGGYGNGNAISNGIKIQYKRFVGEDEEIMVYDFTAQHPIKKTSQWKDLCHDEIYSRFGAGDENISWRYTFTKDTGGEPLRLVGDFKEQLQVIISDDLSSRATSHYFRAGFKTV